MLAYLEEEKGDGGLLVGVKTFDSVLALFLMVQQHWDYGVTDDLHRIGVR